MDDIVWPNHFSELKDLDSSLRCGICFEFMKTAMIIPNCSHNYCSYCIRNHSMYNFKCPTCSENFLEMDLKNNKLLDEITAIFCHLRPKLSKLFSSNGGQTLISASVQLTKKAEMAMDSYLDDTIKTSGTTSMNDFEINYKGSTASEKIFIQSSARDSNDASSNPNKVECPVCKNKILSSAINSHLDLCLNGTYKANLTTPPGSGLTKPASRKRLPKLVYNLMSERELRKKLVEFELPISGDKQKLIRRHKEFTLIYNSECDSKNPRQISQIVKDVIKKENDKNLVASPMQVPRISKFSSQEEIERAQKQYVEKHESHFSELIKAASKNWKAKKKLRDGVMLQDEKDANDLGDIKCVGNSLCDETSKEYSSSFGVGSVNTLPELKSKLSLVRNDDEVYVHEVHRSEDCSEVPIALKAEFDRDDMLAASDRRGLPCKDLMDKREKISKFVNKWNCDDDNEDYFVDDIDEDNFDKVVSSLTSDESFIEKSDKEASQFDSKSLNSPDKRDAVCFDHENLLSHSFNGSETNKRINRNRNSKVNRVSHTEYLSNRQSSSTLKRKRESTQDKRKSYKKAKQ